MLAEEIHCLGGQSGGGFPAGQEIGDDAFAAKNRRGSKLPVDVIAC